MPLKDTFVRQVKATGKPTGDKYADGDGMYLLVKPSGKYWRMDYRHLGKRKTLSIGTYPEVPIVKARERRAEARELLAAGIDPSNAKQEAKQAEKQAATNTFELVAREFHAVKAEGWSEGHATKWLRMCELYLFPTLGRMPVESIKAKHLLAALRKVEAKGILSTAQDVQQMAGQVFRYAVQTGRAEQNPAPDMKGALKPHVAKHFAAVLDPVEAGALLRAMDNYTGQPTTRAALKLSALFFQRPGNIRAMEWSWIDFDNAMITVPSVDMKRTVQGKVNGKAHLIPMASQAIEILKSVQPLTGHGRYVFPGARSHDRPMSDGTINAALRRLDYGTDDHVAHGFRAMARTMLDERIKGIDREMVEAQMGHGKSGPLGSAYDRAEYMDQRRAMMQTWADYLDKLRAGAEVIQFRAA
ncbi:MAG: integrase arm-type DNA-binding domain-containing protein [Hydrogenophaga sp.]|nr:integrase arm-type DNA-binding domain-containing protein [Hydrogenophaga sp.]